MQITVCNVCRNPDEPTSVYGITHDGDTANVDLCAEHGARLMAVVSGEVTGPALVRPTRRRRPRERAAVAEPPSESARPASGRRGTPRVLTMKEIEARKAEAAAAAG